MPDGPSAPETLITDVWDKLPNTATYGYVPNGDRISNALSHWASGLLVDVSSAFDRATPDAAKIWATGKEFRDFVRKLPEYDPQADSILLYRGERNFEGNTQKPTRLIQSYTFDLAVAQKFANAQRDISELGKRIPVNNIITYIRGGRFDEQKEVLVLNRDQSSQQLLDSLT